MTTYTLSQSLGTSSFRDFTVAEGQTRTDPKLRGFSFSPVRACRTGLFIWFCVFQASGRHEESAEHESRASPSCRASLALASARLKNAKKIYACSVNYHRTMIEIGRLITDWLSAHPRRTKARWLGTWVETLRREIGRFRKITLCPTRYRSSSWDVLAVVERISL